MYKIVTFDVHGELPVPEFRKIERLYRAVDNEGVHTAFLQK